MADEHYSVNTDSTGRILTPGTNEHIEEKVNSIIAAMLADRDSELGAQAFEVTELRAGLDYITARVDGYHAGESGSV